MTRFLCSPIDRTKVKKTFFVALVLFCLVPLLINTLILVPIYATLEADVVYKGSALSLIIKYVQDLFDLCAFSVSYALLIFSMLLLSKDTTRLIAIFDTLGNTFLRLSTKRPMFWLNSSIAP